MPAPWKGLLSGLRPKKYGRKHALILLNGLAEQSETWFKNVRFWGRYFDVMAPNLLAYNGAHYQARLKADLPVTIDYLVEQLHTYLTQFVQTPPYHIVSSSLGGKIAVEFAAKYPDLVGRMVLICPSGMGDVEKLPIMDGVRRSDYQAIIKAVFHKPRRADRNMLLYYKKCFEDRKWKLSLVRTVRGTNDHVVRPQMKNMKMPVLLLGAKEDRIVDPMEGERAALELPHGAFVSLPNCGHAPQIEKPWLVNRLVVHFLTAENPTSQPSFIKLVTSKPSKVPT